MSILIIVLIGITFTTGTVLYVSLSLAIIYMYTTNVFSIIIVLIDITISCVFYLSLSLAIVYMYIHLWIHLLKVRD